MIVNALCSHQSLSQHPPPHLYDCHASTGLPIYLEKNNTKSEVTLNIHESLIIEQGTWHMAVNEHEENCSVLEVQYGEDCEEADIERRG